MQHCDYEHVIYHHPQIYRQQLPGFVPRNAHQLFLKSEKFRFICYFKWFSCWKVLSIASQALEWNFKGNIFAHFHWKLSAIEHLVVSTASSEELSRKGTHHSHSWKRGSFTNFRYSLPASPINCMPGFIVCIAFFLNFFVKKLL